MPYVEPVLGAGGRATAELGRFLVGVDEVDRRDAGRVARA
jgi:hypothetical protein